jgi:hypothetical protein
MGWSIEETGFDCIALRLPLGPTQSAIQLIPRVKQCVSVNLTIHLHLVPTLRTHKSIPALPDTHSCHGT